MSLEGSDKFLGSLEAVVLSQQVFLALLWCACW